jgi:hypothetical protein
MHTRDMRALFVDPRSSNTRLWPNLAPLLDRFQAHLNFSILLPSCSKLDEQ